MQIALPELDAPATLVLDRKNRLSDDEYFDFCMANPDLQIERTAQGEIVIVPPAGGDADFRSAEAMAEIREWARRDGRGRWLGSSVQFFLPNGAALSPDAAWVSHERLAGLSKRERAKFLRVVPEFVIEVLSPSDRLRAAQKKMSLWMANGVDLGWLIDGDNRRVYVYRGAAEPRVVADVDSLEGEGPVEGFVMPLDAIWAGL